MAAGIDTSKPGIDYSEEKKGMVIVPGIYDLTVAAEPLPDGRFAALNWVLSPGARVYRVDGDTVEVTSYLVQCLAGGKIDSSSSRWTRRPLRGDPVVPPGKTWAEVLALADESGRKKATHSSRASAGATEKRLAEATSSSESLVGAE